MLGLGQISGQGGGYTRARENFRPGEGATLGLGQIPGQGRG